MALADYVEIPLLAVDGTTITNTRVNVHNIVEVKVINLGKKVVQSQNWVVQIVLAPGKFYYLNTAGAPYATQALAETARDAWLDTF